MIIHINGWPGAGKLTRLTPDEAADEIVKFVNSLPAEPTE